MKEHTVHRIVGILTLAFFILAGLMILFSHTDTSLTHALRWHEQPTAVHVLRQDSNFISEPSGKISPNNSKVSVVAGKPSAQLAAPEQHGQTLGTVKSTSAVPPMSGQHVLVSHSHKPTPTSAASKPAQVQINRWYLQVASLTSKVSAKRMIEELQRRGYRAVLQTMQHQNKQYYRLTVGPFQKPTGAASAKKAIDHRFKVNSIVRQVR